MELSVEKNVLLKELNLTQGVVERKTTIPILSNLLLEAVDSTLRISATDLELGIVCGCPAKIKKEGSGTIPAKRLFEIVRSLPDKEIKLKLLENHWMQVTCERSAFKLVGMAKDNYPTLPAVPEALVSLPAEVLSTMIKRTIFSISSEESRYTLNGALLILKPDNVAMVATDGHRLALIERDLEVAGLKNELRILIPKKAMAELQRLLAEAEKDSIVGLSKDESHLFFSMGHRILISRMLTGQFPNYEAVLPRENNRLIEIDKELFSSAIRRVALLADQRSRAIRVKFSEGQMEIFSSSGEYGEAHETLDIEFSGEPLQIGFNYEYLLDFLGVVDDGGKIRLELKDEQSAGQLRSGEDKAFRYRYVVMPMRV
ncbi:MAG TPA: DNA polymerase III subunit beta [Terriglobia bacterium]|nr:DNA polymerase III subunit beta [Terriglobia bacterium]HVB29479.1 DNA polymerase III subunit beta [Terriglobia bacterium]